MMKTIVLLSLLATSAYAGDFDGVWQGTVSGPSDNPWTPGEPHYGGHFRYEIDNTLVHSYRDIDGAFVEDKDCKWRIRIVAGGAVLSEEPCVRGDLTLVLTTGIFLKRKDANTLLEASVSVDADGIPNGPVHKQVDELVRVQ